jgi:hypothetical protein
LDDLRPALRGEPPLVALVALAVDRCLGACIVASISAQPRTRGPCLVSGRGGPNLRLVDARAKPDVADELLGRVEALDLADLGGDREGEHPADPRGADQQRDVGVVGVALPQPAVDRLDLALEFVDQLDAPAPFPPPRRLYRSRRERPG